VGVETVDVEARPAAKAELTRLGVPAVPAVVLGSRVVHGWNPRALAALVGVAYEEPGRLTPSELAVRLDRILLATQRVMRQVPPEHLGMTHPGRDRSVRQLGYHVFRLALAFRDARLEGGLRQTWLQELAPARLADGRAVADYGDEVREALGAWLGRSDAVTGEVDTYYGPQPAHALLERTTWHAAQHLRQLYDLLGRMGVAPDRPLGEADWEGLPLPAEIW
jgi:hypothetical protein